MFKMSTQWENQRHNERELKEYGAVTFRSESTEFRQAVEVIPVQIEVPSEIDTFVKREILDEFGRTYPKWIQECYLHRMREILKNPAEFGKLVLEEKKRDHCIQNVDLGD
jgi:hypothetical protein